MEYSKINEFVNKNIEWINSTIEKQKKSRNNKLNLSEQEILKLKKYAEIVLSEKVMYYSRLMNLKPTGVKITSAQKRFGSCNGADSLCFSYILMLYPDEAIDYVVVHELAHIRHHNHSKDFYNLVAAFMPDYKNREKMLHMKQVLPDLSDFI